MADSSQSLPVPRVRRSLTTPNQRQVAEGKTGRPLESTERYVPNEGEDVALEGGEVDELAVPLVPIARLALARDVGLGTSACRGRTVCRVVADGLRPFD